MQKKIQLTVNQRIKFLVDALHLTQKEFAEQVGVNQELVSRTINGKTTPNFGFIEAVYKAFPSVNPGWLISGLGDIWKEGTSHASNISQKGKGNNQRVNVGSQVNEPAAPYGCEELEERIVLLEKLCAQKDQLIAEKERYIQLLEKSRP